MRFYAQYDPTTGFIHAVLTESCSALPSDRQEIEIPFSTNGGLHQINLENLEIEEIPYEPEPME